MLIDDQYSALLETILAEGQLVSDRTGTGTISLFSPTQLFFSLDMREAFPLLLGRKLYWKQQVRELLWFLSGSTNINDLPEATRKWWSPWADDAGSLGPTYGYQYRGDLGGSYDPFLELVERIKSNPHSRRHVLTMWNNELAHQCGLNPCHGTVIQFYVDKAGFLDLSTYQRSADVFIGLPNNVGSYAFLLHLVAAMTGLEARYLKYGFGDAHIYLNHLDYVRLYLSQAGTLEAGSAKPQLDLVPCRHDVDEYTLEDFDVTNYSPLPAIKGAPIAI